MFDRRKVLLGGALVAAAAVGIRWAARKLDEESGEALMSEPEIARVVGAMPYRRFGRTGLEVSEVGFGAWAIGGQSYGGVERSESLAALARAEELGCNFVDTAAVYGDSESVLGEFLAGRRDRWVISTKYSGQESGMTETLESQLRALRTDHVDFYMLHWMPSPKEDALLDELEALKRSGKIRHAGVSLYTASDIDRALADARLDGFMVAVSLLDPDPFMQKRAQIAASGKAVIVRSALKEGFLAGGFTRTTRFTDPADQRSTWSQERIEQTVEQVERFRFLEQKAGSLARAALAYPLTYPEVSTLVAGVKKLWEADENFGKVPGYRIEPADLTAIRELQLQLGLHRRPGLLEKIRSLLR